MLQILIIGYFTEKGIYNIEIHSCLTIRLNNISNKHWDKTTEQLVWNIMHWEWMYVLCLRKKTAAVHINSHVSKIILQ